MTEVDDHPRAPVTLVVEYDGADDLVGDFADNLSSGATFVSTKRELETNARVQLVLSFPGLIEPIAIEGVVRWTRLDGPEGDGGASIELDGGAGRDRLAAAIDRVRNRDAGTVGRLLHVLVVEDNSHVAALVENGLRIASRRQLGGNISFAFRWAEDGHAALDLLRRERFDIVLIDVYLPLVNGVEVIAQARGPLGLGTLPFIAMSAGGEAACRAALAAGANVFLDKPMRLRQIVDMIKQLLDV